jgi:diguanylate cyclase (GGDEF)-like protein
MCHSEPLHRRRWRFPSHLEAIQSELELSLTGAVDSAVEMPRKAIASLGAFLLLYLSRQAFHWIPGGMARVGDAFFLPVGAAAVFCCWGASCRCAQVDSLRWFWRLMTLAIAAQLIGDTTMAVHDFGGGDVPFPSPTDLAYLSFYPLLLLALLRVPVASTSRAQRVRLALDLAAVLVGGAMVIWYLVLAPTVTEGGQDTLQMLTSVAYPVGDLGLLAGLGLVLLRWSPAILHRPLSFVAAGLAMFIAADVVYSYMVLHGGYRAGGPIDTLWIAALALFALAGASQKAARPGARETVVPTRGTAGQPTNWLPFAALAVGSLILLSAERGQQFVPQVSLVLAAIGLAALIAARQYVTQREMVRLQRELREAHDELAARAHHDALTSTVNRRATEIALADEIERARRYRRDLSVLFLDIDHFKAINDSYGHAAGDRVLAEFASTVESCLRPVDTLGRWGGEEFVAVLPETDAEEAAGVAERIRAQVEAHRFPLEDGKGLTCSIGAGTYPGDGFDVATLIDVADRAMYEAKRLGRNQVVAMSHADPLLEHV